MKPHQSKRFRRQGNSTVAQTKNTLAGFINPTRSHAADFRRILPGQMDKLVKQGLFERLPHDELGRPQYCITAKGRQMLKDLEK